MFACEPRGIAPPPPDAGQTTIRIERSTSGQILLEAHHVELAVTAEERRQGLRGHLPLATGEALVLIFPRELEVCVVNNGVQFAIDAVFAAEDGKILAIEHDIPAADGSARCHQGVRWVVETAAGQAEFVRPGDRLFVDPLPFP